MMRNQKGFTLIELLIVVVIIGILAAIAIPKFSSTREKAYYSAAKSDLRNLSTQQEIYHSLHYTYASSTTDADLGFSNSRGVAVAFPTAPTSGGWAATAMHEGLDNGTKGCAVYYGNATPPTTPVTPTQAGVVACNDDPPTTP
jgi:prepilin-type N-terminal cleavage/methylation domain-containing protein